jgi:hypothetical protein
MFVSLQVLNNLFSVNEQKQIILSCQLLTIKELKLATGQGLFFSPKDAIQ